MAATGLDSRLRDPIRPCGAIHFEPIGNPAVPFASMHGADQSQGRRIEDLLGSIQNEFIRDVRAHDAPMAMTWFVLNGTTACSRHSTATGLPSMRGAP